MLLFRERASLSAYLSRLQRQKKVTGFVPTMGALHAGHLSLLQAAASRSDIVVCSIFVNPTQFNDRQDFEKYPIQKEEDIHKLLDTYTDILFLPAVNDIYQESTDKPATYDFGDLDTVWEGKFRPRHFQGVGQVMEQLLEIIHPDLLFMGQKDYQQIMIINKLIAILSIKTALISCPTLREPDGLAMSSRNLRLTPAAREKAPAIYQELIFIKEHICQIPFPELTKQAAGRLEQLGFRIDYIAIADRENLQPLQKPADKPMICLLAAWLDGVRLIDNIFLN